MNQDTIELLKEIDSGCMMATNSLEQVRDAVTDCSLKNLIEKYDVAHAKIGRECHEQLHSYGKKEKEPNPMAKAMARVETGMKTIHDQDNKKAVGLLMDGCSMGIRTLSSAVNRLSNADEKSRYLAHGLIELEERFMDDLKGFA